MKTIGRIIQHIHFYLIIALLTTSCHKAKVPLRGFYKSSEFSFQIREKQGFMKYSFTKANATMSISFKENNVVAVWFGSNSEQTAEIKANNGNTEKNGIAYIIDCGKVSAKDTTGSIKQVQLEIWIKTKPNGDTLQAELRQMNFMDAFPMGEISLIKH